MIILSQEALRMRQYFILALDMQVREEENFTGIFAVKVMMMVYFARVVFLRWMNGEYMTSSGTV